MKFSKFFLKQKTKLVNYSEKKFFFIKFNFTSSPFRSFLFLISFVCYSTNKSISDNIMFYNNCMFLIKDCIFLFKRTQLKTIFIN